MTPETLIDLDRYPILTQDGRARVVAQAQSDLARSSAAVLPGFLRPEAVDAMAAETTALIPRAHRRNEMLGAYSMDPEPWMDAEHPVRRTSRYCMQAIATDHLDPSGPTLGVYEWDPLTDLVAEILEIPRLYRVSDPLLRCGISILGDGDAHGWHFDQNGFVVSLLIQKPEQGGHFEYAPAIRSDDDENFETVRAVMDERSDRVRQLAVEPGTLALFQGSRALHRVTTVRGERPRIIALFSYDENPDMAFGAATQMRVFGRTAAEGDRAASA